jgi:hypothetical protein
MPALKEPEVAPQAWPWRLREQGLPWQAQQGEALRFLPVMSQGMARQAPIRGRLPEAPK